MYLQRLKYARDKYYEIMVDVVNNCKRTRNEEDTTELLEEHIKKKAKKNKTIVKNWGKMFFHVELEHQIIELLEDDETIRNRFNHLYQLLNKK
jgi:hypothetical protein